MKKNNEKKVIENCVYEVVEEDKTVKKINKKIKKEQRKLKCKKALKATGDVIVGTAKFMKEWIPVWGGSIIIGMCIGECIRAGKKN